METSCKKYLFYFVFLVIILTIALYFGLKYFGDTKLASDNILTQEDLDEVQGGEQNLTNELKNSKNIYCTPFARNIWPYNDFMLYDKTISFPIVQNLEEQKKFCDFILQNGSSLLENIVFVNFEREPSFSGFASLSFEQAPISASTSTYSVVYNDVFIVSFNLTKMVSDYYQVVIDQIALLDSADRIDKMEFLDLGENGRQLVIFGKDVAGSDFKHYFRTGYNKGNDLYFGEITF